MTRTIAAATGEAAAPETSATDTPTTPEALLLAKIHSLLRQEEEPSSSFTADERCLTALVLLSRVTDDVAYVAVWEQQKGLLRFATQWLSSASASSENPPLALLWVTAATRRLLQVRSRASAVARELGNCLWKHVTRRLLAADAVVPGDDQDTTPCETILQAEGDALTLLVDFSACAPPAAPLEASLVALWRRSRSYYGARASQTPPSVPRSEFPPSAQPPLDNTHTNAAAMMRDTLGQLLPEADDEGLTANPQEDAWQHYDRVCQAVVLVYGKRLLTPHAPSSSQGAPAPLQHHSFELPLVWSDILVHWWETANGPQKGDPRTQEARRAWALILLQLLAEACQQQQQQQQQQASVDSTTTTPADVSFWDLSRWSAWKRLVLASWAATEDATLRLWTWTAVTHVVETTGWPTILSLEKAQTSWITALTRLAAGEYKIQLGGLLGQSTPPTDEQGILIKATSQVVVQSMGLIRVLTDEEGEDEEANGTSARPHLCAAAIENLHRSLEEALDTTVQYLNLSKLRFVEVDTNVIRVFGCLLTEFDAFLGRQELGSNPHDVSGDSPKQSDTKGDNAMLVALSVAIKVCPDACRADMLQGLTAVLASAEGEDGRTALLKENKVFEDPTLELLASCWGRGGNETTVVVSACDAIEVLLDVLQVLPVDTIQAAMVQWLKQAITGEFTELGYNHAALQATLGCYVRLQGDTPPAEPDASVIRRSYELLESLES